MSPQGAHTKNRTNENSKIRRNKKIILSAVIGNGLEFYDFALFGAFSVVFSKLFFTGDKISSSLGTLSIFAAAFFVRPLGSIFFGYAGDRIGRKKALNYSIVLMGVFTFLIGCLPLYSDVGYLAPLLLLGCRLGQGFCLGGENNGSAIFLLKHLHKRKGYAGALVLTGGAVGTILATLFSSLTTLSFMPEWSWRIPFLFGILIALLGTYIRRSLEETPKSALTKKKKKREPPLLFVFKNYTRPFFCAIGLGGVNGVLCYTLVVYINVYLATVVKYPLPNSLLSSCVGLIIFAILCPLVGHIADKIGERIVMAVSCFMILLFPFPMFFLLQEHTVFSIFIAVVMAALMMSIFNAPTNSLLQRLFPPEVRYVGISLGYAIGIALFGATQPLVSTYLIEQTQNSYSPAIYLMFTACVGGITLYFSRKKKEHSLGFSQMTPKALPSI